MKVLQVKSKSQVYPIFFGNSLKDILKSNINKYITKQIFVVSNKIISSLYLNLVLSEVSLYADKVVSMLVPDGEKYKEFNTVNLIYNKLLEENFERSSTLIALGGGVIGDMSGFVASTYQRGINFIQVPTTLLSQVDSSVGGKTAINHTLGKNMIGTFYQPKAVFIGTDVLQSLSKREFSSGLAEIIKYALLGDKEFFNYLENNIDLLLNLEKEVLEYTVYKCCEMKSQIVFEDEKELGGKRALLNLGHTFAHAIEVKMGYGNWLHGEAVAAGLVLSCRLSERLGIFSNNDTLRVIDLLKKAKLPFNPPDIEFSEWIRIMRNDKKVKNSKINFIVLNGIGNAKIVTDVEDNVIKDIISI